MNNFIKKLLIGNGKINFRSDKYGYERHRQKIKKIWNNEEYNDFGMERFFRLFLIIVQYIFPSLFIRDLVGKKGFYYEKIAVELYIISKLIILLLLLYGGFINTYTIILAAYFFTETICYLLGYFFLKDVKHLPVSHKRSMFLIFINYIEVVLYFAIFNLFFQPLNMNLNSATEGIYYSLVTSSALGYGEIYPINNIGKFLVIGEMLTFLLFIVVFFSMNMKGNKEQWIYKEDGKIK